MALSRAGNRVYPTQMEFLLYNGRGKGTDAREIIEISIADVNNFQKKKKNNKLSISI